MAHRKRFGLISLLVGAFAIPAAITATYLQSIRRPEGGLLLQWLDKVGLVSTPEAPAPIAYVISLFPVLEKFGLAKPTVIVTGAPEMTELSAFALNDSRAIGFLFLLSVLLALVALGTALWAEYRREATVFLSAGYICGTLSLALVRPLAGLISGIVGVVAVLILRHQRGQQVT